MLHARRLRRLRRLTAAVAQLLLLQLAVTGGVGTCPLGATAAHAAQAATPDRGALHGEHHAMGAGAPARRAPATSVVSSHAPEPGSPAPHHRPDVRCDMACAAASCGSAGHCSAPAASSSDAPAGMLAAAHGRAIDGGDCALRSVSTSPEPPPPRA